MSALRFALAAVMTLALAGCWEKKDPGFQGWVEADLLFVGPDENGRIETLNVREGDTVAKDATIFTLESELQRADLAQADAALINARQAFERSAALLKANAGTQRAYEDAEAGQRTAQARFNSAQTRLTRRSVESPEGGVVQQVYFRTGEMVTAGRPVVALLPPGNIKVRFYVPEPLLPTIAIGGQVTVRCDGCTETRAATISFISRNAEFTPPVIYSTEERSKLVYLVEARPAQPDLFRVGQPVSVLTKQEPKQ